MAGYIGRSADLEDAAHALVVVGLAVRRLDDAEQGENRV